MPPKRTPFKGAKGEKTPKKGEKTPKKVDKPTSVVTPVRSRDSSTQSINTITVPTVASGLSAEFMAFMQMQE